MQILLFCKLKQFLIISIYANNTVNSKFKTTCLWIMFKQKLLRLMQSFCWIVCQIGHGLFRIHINFVSVFADYTTEIQMWGCLL